MVIAEELSFMTATLVSNAASLHMTNIHQCYQN